MLPTRSPPSHPDAQDCHLPVHIYKGRAAQHNSASGRTVLSHGGAPPAPVIVSVASYNGDRSVSKPALAACGSSTGSTTVRAHRWYRAREIRLAGREQRLRDLSRKRNCHAHHPRSTMPLAVAAVSVHALTISP